jgi:hypothetical protein
MGYLPALALTLALESPIYWLVLHAFAPRLGAPSVSGRDALVTALLVNAATHPVAMLVALPLLRGLLGAAVALTLIEVAVVVVEWTIVRHRHGDPFVAAVAAGSANVASLAIGFALVG